MDVSSPPPTISPRFTFELEFVLSLSNPHYLQHLATVYPHLFIPPTTTAPEDSEATRFAAYLSYLYTYWSTPEYAKFLTHPGAVLNTLKLLQQDQFRRSIIRPDVVEALLRGGTKDDAEKDEKVVMEAEVAATEGQDGEKMDESVR